VLDQLRRLARHSAAYTVGSALARAFAFILVPILTRTLSQDQYGAWVLLNTGVGVLSIFYELGISSSVTRFYYDYDDREERRRYLASVWFYSLGVSGLATVLLLTVRRPLLSALFAGIDFWPFVALMVVSAFLSTSQAIPWVLLRVREQSTRFVVYIVCQSAILLAGVLLFVLALDLGLLGVVLAAFTQTLAMFVFYSGFMLRNVSLHPAWSLLRGSLGYGSPVLVLQVGWWVLDAADRFILKFLTSLEVVAVYSIGYAIGRILIMLSQAINQAWTPFFFQTVKEEREDARDVFSYTATYFTLIVAGFGLVVIVFTREAVLFFGGEAYLDATKVTPLIVLGAVAQSMFYVPSRGLFLKKKTGVFPLIIGVAAVVNLGLNFALIPPLGMTGAALATLAAYVTTAALTFWISQRHYRVDYQVGRLVRIVVILVAVAVLVSVIVPESWAWLLVWQAVLLIAAPLVLYASGFFEEREKRVLARFVRRRLGRGPADAA
jgi:O-antigen/teichoic acid export membrane protein